MFGEEKKKVPRTVKSLPPPISGTPASLSVTAGIERQEKDDLSEEVLKLRMGVEFVEPRIPKLPDDGHFKCGADEYSRLWREVVICEMKSQVAAAGQGSSIPIHVDPDGNWILELHVGEWREPGDRGRGLSISQPEKGVLQLSTQGAQATLTPPGPGNWRTARLSGGREVQVRLRDFNTLEVFGERERKRSGSEVRKDSVMMVSWTGGCRLGLVVQKGIGAAVRLGSDVKPRGACQAKVLGASLTSTSRELVAVKGTKEIPSSILVQLLGDERQTCPVQWDGLGKKKGKGLIPCLGKLNNSQLKAVEAAQNHEQGFSLIWGPPGTGKSATLLSLINALHLWQYEGVHRAIEKIVLEPGPDDARRWDEAIRSAPRLLVTAASNAAVEGLIKRVLAEKFMDRQGNKYEPWSMVRVGADRGNQEWGQIDLDQLVKTAMKVPVNKAQEQLTKAQQEMHTLKTVIARLREELHMLERATPLPVGWEAKISSSAPGTVEFHDHTNRKATWQRPEPPPAGAPCVRLLQMAHGRHRMGMLIQAAERYWQLLGEVDRFTIMVGRVGNEAMARERLEDSFLNNAHVVFATLNSAARLRVPNGKDREYRPAFGAVVVDEAAQATEPAVLVPLERARTRRCVLVGDDRQLPPTIFSPPKAENAGMVSRTLFERLRQLGHEAQLLEEQYRMAPEISAFPRNYFYGGKLRDAGGMIERTRRKIHEAFPPLLFLDVEASMGQRTANNSWRNQAEARVCANLIHQIRAVAEEHDEMFIAEDIGVLTPYRAQQDTLRQELRRQEVPVEASSVQTVDAFQGRECQVIIFSAVRAPEELGGTGARLGFLADERRLNVAITRAKSLLVVIGHGPTLSGHGAWGALLRHVRSTPGAYRHVGRQDESLSLG